jgi:hypothetical protein
MKLTTLSKMFAGCVLASMPMMAGCTASDGSGTSEAELSSPTTSAYNYFVSKGLKNYQAAAIIGNLMQESSMNPSAVQYGGGPGRGLAQWSVGGRWDHDAGDNLVAYAEDHGLSRWSLQAQLDFIWYELTVHGGYGYDSLKGSGSLVDAVIVFQNDFEGCGTCDQSNRIAYAQQVLSAHGGGGGGGGGADCYSGTLGKEMPDNACVQSKFDDLWYQCDNGTWVDRWTDPTACNGVHPL